ncbi:hypothetical protein ISN35_15395 [Xanthomonas translucens pv. undulosa]|uniref:hypothetical protein n=1 Tax=Xanthomonas campestris pv. translucens TaxID=343 RepID=UPI0019D57411|nr:hypothetical protein [Xanthomonas translucens]QSQ40404.1 hypothetical protein ISN33_12040 [Xanthomonas translucens pv. translucens]QSQ48399.1 hypothetical protein ISN35_15395 [Xanthomonas translucens pv. undulosa]
MDIERLAALPLWKLFRARAVMRRRGNLDLVHQLNQAIERRYELFRLGEIS